MILEFNYDRVYRITYQKCEKHKDRVLYVEIIELEDDELIYGNCPACQEMSEEYE